jgi:hypothetical protein
MNATPEYFIRPIPNLSERRRYDPIPNTLQTDTIELFEHISNETPWKIPKCYLDHYKNQQAFQDKWDKDITKWMDYFHNVREGRRIIDNHEISGDIAALSSFNHFNHMQMLYKNNFNIESLECVFRSLLSPVKAKSLKLNPDYTSVSAEDVQMTREFVKRLVQEPLIQLITGIIY